MKGEARATNCRFQKKKKKDRRKEYSRSCIRAARGAQLFEGRQTRGEGRHAAKDPDEINIREEEEGGIPRPQRRVAPSRAL